jgi:hypothetical protein
MTFYMATPFSIFWNLNSWATKQVFSAIILTQHLSCLGTKVWQNSMYRKEQEKFINSLIKFNKIERHMSWL